VQNAVENAWEQQQGWSSGGEGSDGGAPTVASRELGPSNKATQPKQSDQRNAP